MTTALELGLGVYQQVPEAFYKQYQDKCRFYEDEANYKGACDIRKGQADLIKTEQQKVYEEGRY